MRALAERDYFIAAAADGALVWIYRARLPLSSGGEREARGGDRAAGSCTAASAEPRGRTCSAAFFADQREAAPAQRIAEPAVAVDAAEQHVDAHRSRAATSSSAAVREVGVGAPL